MKYIIAFIQLFINFLYLVEEAYTVYCHGKYKHQQIE
jgi:hypothetical protein